MSNKPEEMAKFFDIRADGYDQHMLENVIDFDTFYGHIVEPMEETMDKLKILDIGCGTGLELEPIFKKLPHSMITGIDLSKKMLDLLMEKYSQQKHQLNLIQDSYLSIEFPKEEYDYAVSVMTVHHLLHDKKVELYKKIKESLKANGKYIEGDYIVDEETEKNMLEEYLDLVQSKQIKSEDGFYHIDIPFSIKTQIQLLQEAGFSNVQVLWQSEAAAILVASVK